MTVTVIQICTAAHSLSRSEVIDAVARVVARQGPGALRWAAIVKEAGSPSVSQAWEWYPDLQALLDECYSRTAQGHRGEPAGRRDRARHGAGKTRSLPGRGARHPSRARLVPVVSRQR